MNGVRVDINRITRGLEHAPRNAWYVVAGASEIGASLLARRVLGVPLVLYRTAEGVPVALQDRCPHRWMPLSQGKRVGDEIQCGYHGLRFDQSGKCQRVPGQAHISSSLMVRRYPLIDCGPFTWVWVGDVEKADPDLIPALPAIKPEYTTFFMFCQLIKSNFVPMLENLLDTCHPAYLHAGSFDDGQLAEAPARVETDGRIVRLINDVGVITPGPGTAAFFRLDPGQRVHQIRIIEGIAPSACWVTFRFTFPDEPTRPPVEYFALAPITPVSDRECYHFVANSTSWPSSPEDQEAMEQFTRLVLAQDQVALEAIEHRRDEANPGDREVHLGIDIGSLPMRRLIRSMAEQERDANSSKSV